ncbi:MAG: winged helix-turn-helix domain-containing protein [Candidatus Omnitrophota bacterium]
MKIDIGITAGDIWHYLDEHGEVSLSNLLRDIGKPERLMMMSIGWLAREGHIILTGDDDYKISLTKKS